MDVYEDKLALSLLSSPIMYLAAHNGINGK